MWPQAYWDDWLREPARRKGRQFLRPEVCRTYHFGKKVRFGGRCLDPTSMRADRDERGRSWLVIGRGPERISHCNLFGGYSGGSLGAARCGAGMR